MPLFKFEYKCENCHSVEDKFFRVSPITVVCSVCSGVSVRITDIARKTRKGVTTIFSKSMGINPDQIPEMKKKFPEDNYRPSDGAMEINGYAHQKRIAKRLGMSID